MSMAFSYTYSPLMIRHQCFIIETVCLSYEKVLFLIIYNSMCCFPVTDAANCGIMHSTECEIQIHGSKMSACFYFVRVSVHSEWNQIQSLELLVITNKMAYSRGRQLMAHGLAEG